MNTEIAAAWAIMLIVAVAGTLILVNWLSPWLKRRAEKRERQEELLTLLWRQRYEPNRDAASRRQYQVLPESNDWGDKAGNPAIGDDDDA